MCRSVICAVAVAILISLFLFVSQSVALSQALAQTPGGYTERDVTDKDVVAAAKFALQAVQNDGKKVKPHKILGAASQVVAGTNYWLHLSVIDQSGDKPQRRAAIAVVYQDLSQKYELTSWEWKK